MRERGLSMIEVLVALMIFAVGICSAISVGYVATHWGTKARAEMEAGRCARAVYDYIRRTHPAPDTTVYSQDCAEAPYECTALWLSWKARVTDASDPDLELYDVTITVSLDQNCDGFDEYVPATGDGDKPVAVFNAVFR